MPLGNVGALCLKTRPDSWLWCVVDGDVEVLQGRVGAVQREVRIQGVVGKIAAAQGFQGAAAQFHHADADGNVHTGGLLFAEFYRFINPNAFDKPMFTMHFSTDAPLSIKALLYLPVSVRGSFFIITQLHEAEYCDDV